jgi:hypothetical protein
MKRYLVFAGDNYYPSGGAFDFVSALATLEEATAAANAFKMRSDWAHVFDMQLGRIVYHAK